MAEIGVGLVGYKFMGRAHSNAYRQLPRFFDVDPAPRMVAIAGRDEAGVKEAAGTLGWESYETDYRRLIARDDVGLVDVVTPGNTHREIVLAALEAGKHVLCEKPLANTLAEAKDMVAAARDAGTVNMVSFNYRRAPAVQLAKRLIEEGRLGTIRHWRATYLQDFIMDPQFPLIWRLKKELAGSGALGDIGAHIVDLSQFLVGGISEVVGMTETFVKERPLEEAGAGGGLSASGGAETGEVTVDDAVAFLARFQNGAMGTFEATRFAAGRRNKNAFEINGSKGSVAFNLERMNELEVFFVDDEADVQGFRTVNVTEPEHPFAGAWWPPGHIIGYEHTFVHTMKDLMDGIRTGESPAPTFEDAYRDQAVLDAVERSAEGGGWTRPEYGGI
ncbi:MAG: Oxidoreductase [uncultured Rubrobacteraceae bacterium]|uniref:Oxidoreductase n=1 Tax=uncultured Rubrobacteraceae bacterium TaxID=349277 RepID=A0A6J4QMR2_9ACTN|nr:MAG: Oxidoreductase [uncultured Rubrobacteraceae bacterium]